MLFRDLASMVADQGTVLDRIDYNIVSASHNTDQAVEELKVLSHWHYLKVLLL